MQTTEKTFYRKATVSRAEALDGLLSQFPKAFVNIEAKTATSEEAAKIQGVRKGDDIFVASVRVAEFPPKDEGGSEPSDSAPEESPDAPTEDKPKDESSDESDSGDAPFGGGDSEGDEHGEPKKLKGEELTNHLLQQILDAVSGGAGADDPMGAPGPDGGSLDLPDVGAPGQGEGLPAPGAPGKAPLPPPIPPKGPGAGLGAFAKQINAAVSERGEFTFARIDVKADGLGHRALIHEAMKMAPGFRVARIDTSSRAAEDTALVTMVRAEA